MQHNGAPGSQPVTFTFPHGTQVTVPAMPDDPVPAWSAADPEELVNQARQRLVQLGYRTVVTALADGQFYWHVWRRGERVNGGLSESAEGAGKAAEKAAFRDESCRWDRHRLR